MIWFVLCSLKMGLADESGVLDVDCTASWVGKSRTHFLFCRRDGQRPAVLMLLCVVKTFNVYIPVLWFHLLYMFVYLFTFPCFSRAISLLLMNELITSSTCQQGNTTYGWLVHHRRGKYFNSKCSNIEHRKLLRKQLMAFHVAAS